MLLIAIGASSIQANFFLKSINDTLNMDELDSLSMTVFFIWIVHLFGIPEPILQEFVRKRDFTISNIKELGLPALTILIF